MTDVSWIGFTRHVLGALLLRGEAPHDAPAPTDPASHAGAFVTLHRFGRLRGCMGCLEPGPPTAEVVRTAAILVATRDPRFPRLSIHEWPDVRVTVSILATPRRLSCLEELELGRHGIVVRGGGRRGLFLPEVAIEHAMSRELFLTRCCAEKAGLPADAWRNGAADVEIFETAVFREPR